MAKKTGWECGKCGRGIVVYSYRPTDKDGNLLPEIALCDRCVGEMGIVLQSSKRSQK